MRTVKDAMDWNRRLGHFGGNFGTNFSGHPSPHVRVKREPLWGIVLKAKGIAALLHIAAALPLLLGLNLWVDEAYSLHTSHQPLGQVIVQAMRFEQQPPLYFAVLALWRWISPSVTWARLFSLLCTTLTVVVGGRLLARRVLRSPTESWSRMLTLGVLALNPFLLWSAAEVRLYGLLLLESTLLLWLFWAGFWEPRTRPERSSRRWVFQALHDPQWIRWAYVGVAVAALYTQYYVGLLLVAHGVVLLVQRRRALGPWLRGLAIAFCCCLPLAWAMPTQLAEAVVDVNTAGHWSSGIKLLMRGSLYVLPSWDYGLSKVSFGVLLLGAGVAVGAGLRRSKAQPSERGDRSLQGLALMVGTLLLGFAALAYQLGPEVVQRRHTVVVFMPCLLLVLGIVARFDSKRHSGSRPVLRGWCSLVLCFYLVSLGTDYSPFSKLGDWQQVSRYLMQQEQSGQPILVFTPEAAMPLGHYYSGANRIYPLPEPEEFETYSMAQFQIQSPEQIESVLRNLEQPTSLWLVADRPSERCSYADLDLGCDVLEASLAQDYRTVETRSFNGAWVSLWQRRSMSGGR